MNRKKGNKKEAKKRPMSGMKKFLLVAGLFLLLMMAGVFALYRFYRYYQSPERFVERARELAEQGERTAAFDQYQRALQRTRSIAGRLEIMQSMADNIRQQQPATPFEANQYTQNLLALNVGIFRLSDERKKPAERILNDSFFIADQLDYTTYWLALEEAAILVLRLDDGNLPARKYLNIARLRIRPPEARTERFYAQLREEFMALREEGLLDLDLVFYQANTLITQANDMRQDYLQSRRHQLFDDAVAVIDDYIRDNPDDYLARARRLRIAMERIIHTRSPDHVAKFKEQVEELWHDLSTVQPGQEEAALKLGSTLFQMSVLATGRMAELTGSDPLFELDHEDFANRSIMLLEQIAGPDTANGLQALNRILNFHRNSGERDKALAAAERILSEDVKFSPGPEAIVAWNYQLQARFSRLDLWLDEYEESGDSKVVSLVRKDISELHETLGETNPHVRMMVARLNYLDGDYWCAVRNFAAAEDDFGSTPQSTLLLGLSFARLGETGAAINKLGEYLTTMRQDIRQRRQALNVLAECLLRLREYERAVTIRRRLLVENPDWPKARTELAGLMIVKMRLGIISQLEEAIAEVEELLAPLVAEQNAAAVRNLAVLYLETGRQEKAAELLADYCKTEKADGWAYSTLYSILISQDQGDEAGNWLERVLDRAEESRARTYLASAADGDEQWGRHIGNLIYLALERDEVNRTVELFQFLQRLRISDEAAEVLRKLQDIAPDDPRTLELRFLTAFSNRDWGNAERIAEQAVMIPKMENMGKKWLAQVDLARGDNLSVLERMQRMVFDGNVDSEVYSLLGIAYRRKGDLRQAQDALEQAVSRRPENINTLRHMIDVTVERGLGDQTMRYMRIALRLAPEDEQLVRIFLEYLERFESSEQALQVRLQMAERLPDDHQNLLHIVDLYLQKGHFEEADELLSRLRSERPDDFQAVMLTARLKAMRGEVDEGRESVSSFLQRRGDLAGAFAWTQYAEFLEQSGAKEDDILEAVSRGRSIEDEQNPVASRYLASLRMRQGRAREALRVLNEAYGQTGDKRLLLVKGEAHLMLGEREEARRHVNTFLSEEIMTGSAGLLLARIQAGDGEHREALRTLDRVVDAVPGMAEAYVSRAELLWNNPELAGDDYSVRENFQKALDINPGLSRVRYMLVGWFMENNRSEEAIANLRLLKEQEPLNNRYRDVLSRLYLNQGEYDQLRENLDKWSELVTDKDSQAALLILMWRARLESGLGNHQKAADYLAEVYDKAPEDVGVLNEYLLQLLHMNNYRKVVDLINYAGEDLRSRPRIQVKFARALAAEGERESALAAFVRAFTEADSEPLFQYQVLETARQNISEDSFSELLAMLEPYDSGLLYTVMFRALEDYDRGEWQRAEERLQEIRRTLDQTSHVYNRSLLLLANVFSKQKKHVEAKEILEEVLNFAPRDPVVLNNLAYEIAIIGEHPFRAVELAERAVNNLGRDGSADLRARILSTLGYVQYKAGLLAYAETSLERSLRLMDSPNAYLNLGRVYLQQERTERAIDYLRQAVQKADATDGELIQEANELIAQAEKEL